MHVIVETVRYARDRVKQLVRLNSCYFCPAAKLNTASVTVK